MSQMETHIGKMIEVDMNGLSLEEWCKNYCKHYGIDKLQPYCDTWVEQFNEEFSYRNEYVIANNKVYQIIDDKENDGEDVFYAKRNPDGSINYVFQYYNGGCCFSEAIEYALDRMKE